MTLKISEQDIVNSICLYIAEKKQISPEDVEVELMFDDDYGYSAEAYSLGRKQILITQNIIEAIRIWLEHVLHQDPFSPIELILDDEEGIIAIVG
ncbi:YxcD family protein [Bacillus massilinigeriensis]|uniref:YxcD family protein n=1 Tax=Bacillus massilionigeriensis TaxID=1805475 RepID=UPI00096B3E69|nr:YxcD family protein [Bacillus massilionigeriensis]